MKELVSESEAIVIYSDNPGAQSLASNPAFHNKTKHADLRYHFTRGTVGHGQVHLKKL
jgi:hypothetical protein